MCDANTLKQIADPSLLIKVGGTFARTNAASKSAAANNKALHRSTNQQLDALNANSSQTIDASGEDISDAEKAARAARASVRLKSAESGIGGLSIQRLVNTITADLGTTRSRITRNTANAVDQNERRRQATMANQELNIKTGPDGLAAGLEIVGYGLDANRKRKEREEQAKKDTKKK